VSFGLGVRSLGFGVGSWEFGVWSWEFGGINCAIFLIGFDKAIELTDWTLRGHQPVLHPREACDNHEP